MVYPLRKGKYAKQAHLNLPEGTYEEEHGREGFYGKVSHLYRTHPPTSWTRIEGNLKPRAYDCNTITADETRKMVLYNSDLAIYTLKLSKDMDHYYRNADGDEVQFVHQGEGKI